MLRDARRRKINRLELRNGESNWEKKILKKKYVQHKNSRDVRQPRPLRQLIAMPDSSLPFIHYSFLIPHSPRFRHQQRPPTVSYNKTDMEIIHKGPPCDAAKTTQQPASLNSGHELKLRGEKNRVIRLHVGRMLVFHFIKKKYIIIFFNFHFVCLARIQNRGN